MRSGKMAARIASAVMKLVLWSGILTCASLLAQSPASPQANSGSQEALSDPLQRSTQIYTYRDIAPSGPLRGEQIYFNKCWVCHNKFTVGAPHLDDLYQRAKLVSGQPVNDQTVADKIRGGGPRMPGYRYSLADAEIADLVSYLRQDHCCYDSANPPANPRYRNVAVPAVKVQGRNFHGGPTGLIRARSGQPLEGIAVQLIAENSVRTTVYSNEKGRYEFPKLADGSYTLRIARPLEFQPFRKDSLQVHGATEIPDTVLDRVSDTEFLPPTPEIMGQLTGAEWLLNISGTGQEKRVFSEACGFGCHASYEKILRNRFDEHGWRTLLERMNSYQGSLLVNPMYPPGTTPKEGRRGRTGLTLDQEIEIIAKWLARVRGPESKDPPVRTLLGPRGAATRVIITEYELPHLMITPHDVVGDSKGHIWYTSHRGPCLGELDPSTGIVKEYRVPPTPGANAGQHWLALDKNGVLRFSEPWAFKLSSFDPRSQQFSQVQAPLHGRALNSPGVANMALDPEGYYWQVRDGTIEKIDPKTGLNAKEYHLQKVRGTYGNDVNSDGSVFVGGAWPQDFVVYLNIRSGELLEIPTRTKSVGPARAAFDPQGNAWFGGKASGLLIKLDAQTHQLSEYVPPTPYVVGYEANADKNGDIWMGYLHGGRFGRFNPRTERWIEYVLPEPYSHNRRSWIDNSTDPPTIWYPEHNGYIVRIEPLE